MKREFLKKLELEDEVIDKIMSEHGKSIESEKAKTTSIEEENKTLKEQITEANKEIKSYKDMNIEDIQKSVEEWKSTAKENEKALQTLREDTALKDAIRELNTVDADGFMKFLDRESLTFKDDKIIGLDEQVANLKESKAYLFNADNEDNADTRFNSHEPPNADAGGVSAMQAQLESIFNE